MLASKAVQYSYKNPNHMQQFIELIYFQELANLDELSRLLETLWKEWKQQYLGRKILNQVAVIERKINTGLDCNNIYTWFSWMTIHKLKVSCQQIYQFTYSITPKDLKHPKTVKPQPTPWSTEKRNSELSSNSSPPFPIPTRSSLSSPAATAEKVKGPISNTIHRIQKPIIDLK